MLLAGAVLTKYVIVTNTSKLKQRFEEMKNESLRLESKHNNLCRAREELESEEKSAQRGIDLLEQKLDTLKTDITEQEQRNTELEERIEKSWR